MALYKLIISKQVRKKDLSKIPPKSRKAIVDLIGSLRQNPRPAGVVKLTNREEYRMRVGNYRVLYVIKDGEKIVEVRKARHRGEAYKK